MSPTPATLQDFESFITAWQTAVLRNKNEPSLVTWQLSADKPERLTGIELHYKPAPDGPVEFLQLRAGLVDGKPALIATRSTSEAKPPTS